MRIPDDILLSDRLWTELVQWRSGYRCERCGLDRDGLVKAGRSKYLTGHHKDHDHNNNRLNNGECLCPSCHQKHHGGGSKPCEPGCTCKRHKRAYNRLSEGVGPKCGHENWYRNASGHLTCRICRNKVNQDRYYSDPDYRRKQIERTTIRRRLKRGGE